MKEKFFCQEYSHTDGCLLLLDTVLSRNPFDFQRQASSRQWRGDTKVYTEKMSISWKAGQFVVVVGKKYQSYFWREE